MDFRPEVSFIAVSLALTCVTEGLARVTASQQIEGAEFVALAVVDVADTWDVRPMLLQDTGRIFVNLNLADAGVASAFKSEVDSADAGEEAEEFHCSSF
jgi:hypothetical protein